MGERVTQNAVASSNRVASYTVLKGSCSASKRIKVIGKNWIERNSIKIMIVSYIFFFLEADYISKLLREGSNLAF